MLLDVRSGKNPAEARRHREVPTVKRLVERFLIEYLPNKKRPPTVSTLRSYESLIRCHIVSNLGRKSVDAVTTADVERLHAGLRETPYTANRMLSVLQQAFDQAEKLGYRHLHTNPVVHIERFPEQRRGAKKDVMLSAQQMRSLLDAINSEEQRGGDPFACAAIRVAFWTGWRIGEVQALRWENVDLDTGTAKLIRTKTAEEEYRQLPSEALSIIGSVSRVAGCLYVFPGKGLKEALTTVRRPWERIRKRAGLDNLTGLGAFRLHDLRHNVVSWDVSRGVGLEIAGKNVGHRSRQATEIYAHFAPDALKRAADARAAAMREAVEKSAEARPPKIIGPAPPLR